MAYTLTYTLNSDGNSYTLSGFSGEPTGELVIPDSYDSKPVTSIGNTAFRNCRGLTSVTIGNSVISIGSEAFYYCTGLTSVTIGNSVTSIGERAFRDCSGLTGVTMGNNVTSIGNEAFYRCSGLTSITIPDSVTSIGTGAFSSCTGLTSVTIGNSVTSIGGTAFADCTGLTSITIPNSVMSIGGSAFNGCSGLTSVTIGSGVTSIGKSVFYKCTGLTSITIPDNVTSIENSAFYGCGLTSITIPNRVTSIGNSAFAACANLTSITVSTGNSVYHSAGNCIIETATKTLIAGCKTSVIPAGVTSIGENAFRDCSGLTSITIPDSVTSIGNYAFRNCRGLTSITIPDSVTSIGSDAFNGCSGLTSVTIGNGVTSIGYNAFFNCSGLTSIMIPSSVTSIGSHAFYNCSRLTSVTIGNSVISIDSYTFRGCSSLTKINMLSTTPPTIHSSTLVTTIQNIYVPSQSAETYKTATNWNTYADKITEFPILDLSSLLIYNNKVKAKIDTVKSDGGSGGVGQKGTGEGAEIFNSYYGEYKNVASGSASHAEGWGTKASGESQHAQGKYNVEDTENKYAHIVGNGTGNTARSNAHTLDWNGNAWYAGKVSGGTPENPAPVENANDYVTKKHFENMSKGGTPINKGDTLSKLYFDTEKTPDLSIFTYTLDEDMGFYTAGLTGFKNASNVYIGYLSAVKVSDTVYAIIYENRATGDITYFYVSDNIEYGGTSFAKGWQSFNNPFPVTSGTVADLDQTATKPWNGVWVSEKAFYARTDEIPAKPNNGTLTIQKNGTTVGTFGANQSENTTANIDVPTKLSQLQNDAGYTKNKGTVISVRVNGTTYTADANGLVNLGTISSGTTYNAVYNEIY